MPQDWFSQNAPKSATPAPAGGGGDWFAANAPTERRPDFSTTNEKDAAGNAVVADKDAGVGGFIRHWWAQANPALLGQLLPFPKAWGGSGMDHPLAPGGADEQFAPKFVRDLHALKLEADRLWEQGDRARATAKYVDSVIPILGPLLSQMGDEAASGHWLAMLGDAAGFGTAIKTAPMVPKALDAADTTVRAKAANVAATVRAALPKMNLNPMERASNEFAAQHDIPLDAATATGSRAFRSVQKVVGNTMAGEGPATATVEAQRAGLERVGTKLAADANPGGAAQTPETAGRGVVQSIRDLIAQLHDQANQAYGSVRRAGASNVDTVPKAEDPTVVRGRQAREQASIGYSPSEQIRQHLRVIREELNNVQYSDGKLVRDNIDTGDTHYVPRSANAPVYHDITDAIPGSDGTHYTGADMIKAIDSALETGHFTNAAKGALSVAERRAAGKFGGMQSRPLFDPSDATFSRGTQDLQMAVDLRDAKQALKPLYDRMLREGQLAPLMGEQARALRALDKIVNGPDFEELMVVDAALGELKGLARGGKNGPALPELRTAGQGRAAAAVVELERLVRKRAEQAGPNVLRALEEGRSATKGKIEVGELFDVLDGEPVGAFNQLTAPKDAHIELLRQVREAAPASVPDVARAWLEQRLELAQREGGFGHADKLWSDWNNLGPETKRILFSAEHADALDRFFLLAKRIGENPNPSGSAHTFISAANLAGAAATAIFHPLAGLAELLSPWAVSKLLYSKGGVQALTKWMQANANAGAVTRGGDRVTLSPSTAQAAAWAGLVQAGRQVGVDLPAVPKAADTNESR